MINKLFFKKIKFVVVPVLFLTTCFIMSSFGFAAEPEFVAQGNYVSIGAGLGYLAAAFAIAAGSVGAGFAVASSAPAALGAFSENPSAFGKTIVFVALGEGVSILSFIVAMMIVNNLA
ncbi:MAG: ATPase [Oscillospiraceae bacterium]|nr:ATPase [Oscillospiraceae bacterium]